MLLDAGGRGPSLGARLPGRAHLEGAEGVKLAPPGRRMAGAALVALAGLGAALVLEELIRVDLPGAAVAFSTRQGGVSEGPFESLNLGRLTADRPDAVPVRQGLGFWRSRRQAGSAGIVRISTFAVSDTCLAQIASAAACEGWVGVGATHHRRSGALRSAADDG